MNRRQFIAGAGAFVAGVAAGGLPRLTGTALGATPALTPARRATYRRLLAALGQAPGGRFAHREAAAGTRAFAGWYAAAPEGMRRHADAVLDAAGELPSGYAALRDLPGGAAPTPEQAHRRAVLMAAVALVEGPGDERAPTEALS